MTESPSSRAAREKLQQKQSHCCISHEFFRAASQNPNKVAVIHSSGWAAQIGADSTDVPPPTRPRPPSPSLPCAPSVCDGDKCFTFAEVLSSVDSLSSRLRSILDGGCADDPFLVKPRFRDVKLYGDASRQAIHFDLNAYMPHVIGVYMPPSVEYIISVLSIMRCGEAFLPLDPSWPRQRILSTISSSNASLVIACGSSFDEVGSQPLERSHWLVENGICPVLFFSMGEDSGRETVYSSLLWPCQKERQRAFCYLMYTSGSTGKPKGVCGTEQGLLNRFLWMQEFYPVFGEERLAFKTSVSFVDHLQEFLGAILTSTPLVIPPFTLLKENMFFIVDFLEAYSISRLIAVPSMMRAILPTLQSHGHKKIQSSLKLVILSGEVFPLSLWNTLHNLLPNTCILNLYGSTEISGDCTYFDCRRLPELLETESIASVPIGMPISNCDIVLLGDGDKFYEGEIYVGGLCVSNGYLHMLTQSDDYVKLHGNSICNHLTKDCGSRLYFRTGDFGRQLPSGDLVFVGRRDRTIKLNGHRIALEEIETTLRLYPGVAEAVVVLNKDNDELASIEAFLILDKEAMSNENIIYSIRNWMVDRLMSVMVPSHFVLVKSLPISSTGKVDYESLASLRCSRTHTRDGIYDNGTKDLMQAIRKGFCDALVVKEVSDDDDFFAIGGDSLAAAHLSHDLGIDMRLVYKFPSPSKLALALLEKKELHRQGIKENLNQKLEPNKEGQNNIKMGSGVIPIQLGGKSNSSPLRTCEKDIPLKRLKIDSEKYAVQRTKGENPWDSPFALIQCSFGRCNNVLYTSTNKKEDKCQVNWSVELPGDKMVSMQELWKVHMESCVDASPLLVFKCSDIYLFIGSHSHKFLCIDAKSGSVRWETILEGRIEGSAVVVDDFSQVVIGCYGGKIYFLDFSTGSVCWTFRTCGEVKCQPVVDRSWQLIWCGSHDHTLYALDYRNHRCVYKLKCGGSIFGSPAIDEDRGSVYVASTSGRVTAISIRAFPFYTMWLLELEAPIFGSLSISLRNGSVICCLVDGQVVALSPSGTITWRYRTGGPIFAGPCMSHVLPSQVLVCSRNGSVYSLELERGHLVWEHNIGDPITASAYIDENLHLESDQSPTSDRLVCVCSSSGTIHVLRVSSNFTRCSDESKEDLVQEFARLDLQGDIFSSPVMTGGRIFVGCRDDYVHCISLENTE